MRLGGSVPKAFTTVEDWAKDVRELRFSAVSCPLPEKAAESDIRELLDAARSLDVVIAEVGVWRNTLSPDAEERRRNVAYAKERLALADRLGSPCCVNIVGAVGAQWDGAYAENYSERTYEQLVDMIREIIDDVKPSRSFYTIEPMPWMIPDGPDAYERLLADVDRSSFGVHMDFVNMINQPKRYLSADDFVEECLERLAPHTKSIHIKDVLIQPQQLPFSLHECSPGEGTLDYGRILRTIDRLFSDDMPVLLEHMQTMEEYKTAYDYVSRRAAENGIRY